MTDFKYKFTQVLALISQAKKEQLLTDDERKKIKEHIISEEPDLTIEMEKYNKDNDLSGVAETLKLLAGITAMSSPLDNSLFQKKRDQQHKRKKKSDDKDKDKDKDKAKTNPNTEDEDMDVAMVECDIGNSPVIQPKTLKKNKGK